MGFRTASGAASVHGLTSPASSALVKLNVTHSLKPAAVRMCARCVDCVRTSSRVPMRMVTSASAGIFSYP